MTFIKGFNDWSSLRVYESFNRIFEQQTLNVFPSWARLTIDAAISGGAGSDYKLILVKTQPTAKIDTSFKQDGYDVVTVNFEGVTINKTGSNLVITAKGPIGKFFSNDALKEMMKITEAKVGDSIFLACGKKDEVEKILSLARNKIAKDLDIVEKNQFSFCWIVDYPMYELDNSTNKIVFSHNPFSMPQGDLSEKDFENPLDILAYQYDIVCNGIELSSGAIRNHKPELMYKLFSIAGYDKNQVDEKFSGMINALSYGAPPHGGIAPGIDRIVMLLANEKNIREVTMFPMNQNAQDLMMNAPSEVNPDQLKELNLTLKTKK